MVRMLGDRVLPESVQSRRRQLRSRLEGVRQPVRQFREQKVPGPDIVGMTEEQLSSLRDRFVSRDAVIERVREMRSGSSDSGGSNNSSSTSSSSNTSSSGSTL